MQIAFIGGGNMATALISGLMRKPRPGTRVCVAEPNEQARQRLRAEFTVETFDSATEAISDADVIVLAIKPQVMPGVLAEISNTLLPTQLILSIAAGTPIASMVRALHPDQAVIRCMPNTPALIGAGISGLCANRHCRQHHREQAERILAAAGDIVWIEDESLMDAVTAISGSGPAYFFLLAEALASAGEQMGLPREVALQLASKTCVGAGAMLAQSDESPEQLRLRVTSPGGTTEAAIESFQQGGLGDLVLRAAKAAENRGRELADAT
jgi:pyrroline-5-carboxylate reductase